MAKKKYNDIPRKKKKELKKKHGLEGQKVKQTDLIELANKDFQKEQRRQAQARRYNENKVELEKLGAPASIISFWTTKAEARRRAEAYLKEEKARKRREAAERRYNDKLKRLTDAGYTDEEARGILGSVSRQAKNETVDKAIAEKKNLSHWLYIGFAEKVSGFKMFRLSQYSDDELVDMINGRINNADENPDSSDDDDEDAGNFTGIFKFGVYKSKDDALHVARQFYKRGYNLNFKHKDLKLDDDSYQKITIGNVYTRREFLEMTYTCIKQMLNWQVTDFIKTLHKFDNENGTTLTDGF